MEKAEVNTLQRISEVVNFSFLSSRAKAAYAHLVADGFANVPVTFTNPKTELADGFYELARYGLVTLEIKKYVYNVFAIPNPYPLLFPPF